MSSNSLIGIAHWLRIYISLTYGWKCICAWVLLQLGNSIPPHSTNKWELNTGMGKWRAVIWSWGQLGADETAFAIYWPIKKIQTLRNPLFAFLKNNICSSLHIEQTLIRHHQNTASSFLVPSVIMKDCQHLCLNIANNLLKNFFFFSGFLPYHANE